MKNKGKSVRPSPVRDKSFVTVCDPGHPDRVFIVRVVGSRKPDKIRVDLDNNAEQCDYAVKVFGDKPKRIFFFVELKGGDVTKAYEQLLSTIQHSGEYESCRDCGDFVGRYACAVVSKVRSAELQNGRFRRALAGIRKSGFTPQNPKVNQLTACVAADYSVSFK